MARYIDKDALLEKMQERCDEIVERYSEFEDSRQYIMGFREAVNYAENEQTADVQEVRNGKWLLRYVGAGHYHYWECSMCHKKPCIYVAENTKYCPNCGAKMDAKQQEK